MAGKKSGSKMKATGASEQEGLLASAARSVGHAVGKAAMAVGLEDVGAVTKTHSKIGRRKAAKPSSVRSRRKTQAEEVKAKATKLMSKGAADLGAPFRRAMGKPAGNWSDKDIEYVKGMVAKVSA